MLKCSYKRKQKGLILLAKENKDTSYLRDFVGGVDPTGVMTFNNSLRNEKNHGKHKLFGNMGGFAGGAAIGAAMPAALGYAASKALKVKNPGLAKDFSNMARGSADLSKAP